MAWDKYGKSEFTFDLVEEVSERESLFAREQYWIDTHRSAYGNGYNVSPTAGGARGFRHSEETRAKMSAMRSTEEARKANSERQKGRKPSDEARANFIAAISKPEYKAKQVAANANRRFPQSAIDNARLVTLGKPLSEEHKRKIGAPKIGKPRSQDTKDKLRAFRLGSVMSQETKDKISLASRMPRKPLSEETKSKIRDSLLRFNSGALSVPDQGTLHL